MWYVNPKISVINFKSIKMKKIGKLSINPEKVIKNEDLVNLRGGYSDTCYYFYSDYNYTLICCTPTDRSYNQVEGSVFDTSNTCNACDESDWCS